MAEEKIEANKDKIDEEITNLNNLLNTIESDDICPLEIEGCGYTRQYMDFVESNFVEIIEALKFMIQCTVISLEDIKDGYIKIDEVTRDSIEKFKEEVLG